MKARTLSLAIVLAAAGAGGVALFRPSPTKPAPVQCIVTPSPTAEAVRNRLASLDARWKTRKRPASPLPAASSAPEQHRDDDPARPSSKCLGTDTMYDLIDASPEERRRLDDVLIASDAHLKERWGELADDHLELGKMIRKTREETVAKRIEILGQGRAEILAAVEAEDTDKAVAAILKEQADGKIGFDADGQLVRR